MASGMWEGIARATNDLAETGLGVANALQRRRESDFNNLRAIDQDRMNREIQERERIKFDNAQKKLAEEEQANNAWVPLSEFTSQLSPQSARWKNMEDYFKSNGFNVESDQTGMPYIQRKAMKGYFQYLKENNEGRASALDARIFDLNDSITKLEASKAELKKPEEVQGVDEQIKQLRKQYAGAIEAKYALKGQVPSNTAEEDALRRRALDLKARELDLKARKMAEPTKEKEADETKAIDREIKQLDAFEEKHKHGLGEEGVLKIEALRSGLRNGTIKPGTIKYPSQIDKGNLVHKKSNEATDPLGIRKK